MKPIKETEADWKAESCTGIWKRMIAQHAEEIEMVDENFNPDTLLVDGENIDFVVNFMKKHSYERVETALEWGDLVLFKFCETYYLISNKGF